MDQSRQDFLLEIEELIEQVFADLDELRDKREEGPARRKLLASIFRRVHSIKGSSASSGLDQVSKLAHHLENLLAAIRTGRVGLNDTVLDTIEGAGNLLADSLSSVTPADNESAVTTLIAHLQELDVSNAIALPAKAETALSKLPSEIWQSLGEDQKAHLARVLEEGANLFVIASRFDIEDFDQQFYRLKEKLEEFGELVSTYPTVDTEQPDKINFRLLFASTDSFHQIRAEVADFRGLSLTNLSGDSTSSETKGKQTSGSQRSLSRPSQSSVRLDLNELDGLIAAGHELFRMTTDALEHAIVNVSKSAARKKLQTRAGEIRQSFLKIEDQIINLRMVSIGGILKRAERAGREAARLANKDVSLETSGLELRLDKLLADAVANPLVHLMRNAVDHGIETAEERARLGKPKRGLIRIEAVAEGSQTRIRVTDDGRGIDPLLVSEAARKSGLIERDVVLDIDHSLRLIFRPGFSTAGIVSTTSGRGVGLDVVETAVEQAGGEVLVSTEPGRGTTFEIRLPVTFGLLHSTVVTSNNSHYCIDLSQVVDTPLLEISSEGSAYSQDRVGSVEADVPLIYLRELLGHSAKEGATEAAAEAKETAVVTVTCQFPSEEPQHCKRVALVVDSIEGAEQVLVRNLGRYAGRWYGIAGVTELRDGTVALVLDLPRLIHASSELNP